MQHSRKTSIRHYLIMYIGFAIIAGIVITAFSNYAIHVVTASSREIFACNSELADFYSTIREMDAMASELVYEDNEENPVKFSMLRQRAENNLSWCIEHVDKKMQRRFRRLISMLDYYQAPLDDYMRDKESSPYTCYLNLRYRAGLITSTSSKYYGWLAAYMSENASAMEKQWTLRRNILLGIFVLYTFIWFLIAGFFSREIADPLAVIAAGARELKQENYNIPEANSSVLEVKILNDAIQDMAKQIELHINTLKDNAWLEKQLLSRENENLAMYSLMTEANLRNLQSQINPHFLFNTLSMISHSAYIDGNVEVSEMMDRLSAVLRYALDKADQASSLYEELESIRNYFYIQQKRFGDRILFRIDMGNDVPNIRMPAIILQPLVENSIIHGVGDVTEQGEIIIKLRRENERVNIHVEDNGVGMKAEQLEELLAEIFDQDQVKKDEGRIGLGLKNVYRRLLAYYGTELRFSVESEEDCGTIVTINIPVEDIL